MTFKDEVDAAGERYWKSAYEDRVTDVLDACVEKIDELERDIDNVRAATVHTDERMDRSDFVEREGNRIRGWDISKGKIPPELAGPGPYDLSAAHDFTGPGEHPEE